MNGSNANPEPRSTSDPEAIIAHLARAAYETALNHGITGPFAELELAIWHQLRVAFESHEVAAGA